MKEFSRWYTSGASQFRNGGACKPPPRAMQLEHAYKEWCQGYADAERKGKSVDSSRSGA